VEKLTEFPALEQRRGYLEQAAYAAQQQINTDTTNAGRPDAGVLTWLASIQAELRELRYALAVLGRQGNSRIEISGRTALLIAFVLAAVLLIQITVLMYLGH